MQNSWLNESFPSGHGEREFDFTEEEIELSNGKIVNVDGTATIKWESHSGGGLETFFDFDVVRIYDVDSDEEIKLDKNEMKELNKVLEKRVDWEKFWNQVF